MSSLCFFHQATKSPFGVGIDGHTVPAAGLAEAGSPQDRGHRRRARGTSSRPRLSGRQEKVSRGVLRGANVTVHTSPASPRRHVRLRKHAGLSAHRGPSRGLTSPQASRCLVLPHSSRRVPRSQNVNGNITVGRSSGSPTGTPCSVRLDGRDAEREDACAVVAREDGGNRRP
jgi:hypothetical protein